MNLKTLIIIRNRLTLAVKLADWCFRMKLEPIFIDNGSDYPDLLKYYKKTKYQVYPLNGNYGHTCVWNPDLNILGNLGITGRYIVTDSDLDLSGVPADFLALMNKGLDKYEVDKCGLSLEIDDLPNSKEGNYIRFQCEAKYWKTALDGQFFKADTDTTFALYREGAGYSHSAVRTNRPYTAKHIPWYYTDFNSLPEDEKYYFTTASESSSGKKRLMV